MLQGSETAGVEGRQHGQDIVINVDMVPANQDEIADQEEDEESLPPLNPGNYPESDDEDSQAPPDLIDGADSSDDESYAPDDQEDIELEDVEEEPLEDEPENAPRRSRRNRTERDFFVPNQRSYMHVGVTSEPRVQVINPKMFNPMAVRQFGIKKPDLYNMSKSNSTMPQDDLSKPLEIAGDEVEVLGIIMSQMSLKEGLRLFGERAEEGATKEMKQP